MNTIESQSVQKQIMIPPTTVPVFLQLEEIYYLNLKGLDSQLKPHILTGWDKLNITLQLPMNLPRDETFRSFWNKYYSDRQDNISINYINDIPKTELIQEVTDEALQTEVPVPPNIVISHLCVDFLNDEDLREYASKASSILTKNGVFIVTKCSVIIDTPLTRALSKWVKAVTNTQSQTYKRSTERLVELMQNLKVIRVATSDIGDYTITTFSRTDSLYSEETNLEPRVLGASFNYFY